MKYNKKEYKYYVIDLNDNLIHSGWYYRDDALEALDELLEGIATAVTSDYMIYSKIYLKNKIDLNNNNNWLKGVK
tara:strand:- start:1583 stop:1807 length:225 start_codon:yes stop_codon:yes gene_type:complete